MSTATYHTHVFLHPGVCQDFGATNTDRFQRSRRQRPWGEIPQGRSHFLGGRQRSCKHGYAAEGRPGIPGSLLGGEFGDDV